MLLLPCKKRLTHTQTEEMEDLKKRKIDETGNAQLSSTSSQNAAEEELRSLLDPLAKPQLLDLLAKLVSDSQYPSIAEEIKTVASADPVHRKLFVRGLAWNTTSEALCAAFQVHGEIEEGAVITDKPTGKSRGYGFITYKDMESAQRALRAPGKLIDGQMVVCNLASEGLSNVSATPDLTHRKLFIGGLSPDTSSEMLLAFFGKHGEIEEGSVAHEKNTNKSRGFGFITYKTVEAAKQAIDDPQKILGGRNIFVKLADNHKGKVVQTQLPAAIVSAPIPLTAGYPQPGNPHSSAITVGYTYAQPGTYPNIAYPSPTPVASQYSTQHQISYPSPTSAGIGGYPYYIPKQ